MKRRLLVLLSSFSLLLLAFWAYRLATEADWSTRTRRPPTRPVDRQRTAIKGDRGLDLHVEMRDEQGRLQAVYDWPRWEKLSDEDVYRVEEPRVVLYQSDGNRIYVWADEGIVHAERVGRANAGSGYNIRRGTLTGKGPEGVKVFLDTSDDPFRAPPQERSEAEMRETLMRFFTDRIDFDNQRLNIHTDSEVKMLSRQADIFGRGLDIRWNEAPRELTQLRLAQGHRMVLYDVGDQDELLAGPGQSAFSPAATAPSTQEAPLTVSASRPADLMPRAIPLLDDNGPVPLSRPAAPTRPATRPSTAPVALPTSRAATRPVRPSVQRKNVYLAEFYENVHVQSAARSLTGADKLTMEFEWAGQSEEMGGRRKPSRRDSRKTSKPPSPQPSPTTEPALAESDPAIPPHASRPASRTAQDTNVTITWQGAMVLTPLRHVDKPTRGNYLVNAEGERVVLKDSQGTAVCRSFVFERQRPQEGNPLSGKMKGQLRGTAEDPARLLLADGQVVACEDIRFDRITAQAVLRGPGYMTQPGQKNGPASAPTASPAAPKTVDRITWRQSVVAIFGRDASPSSGGTARDFVKSATFRGNVQLAQDLPVPLPASVPAEVDMVESDVLHVVMDRTQAGRVFPKVASATGNAHARQDTTDIRADAMAVVFEAQPVVEAASAPASAPAPHGRSGRSDGTTRARPSRLTAIGNVVVLDKRDQQPLRVEADQIYSDPVARTALVIGKDREARISQGPNIMSGRNIRLGEAAQSAIVTGPGSLDFLTDKDLNGVKMAKPRPIRIAWDRSMDYAGTRNSAIFNGNVKLRSDCDQMDCQQMQVIFEKVDPPAKPASAPADKPAPALADATAPVPPAKRSTQRESLGLAEYSKRRVAMILADNQVVLQTRREDAGQHLLRRVQLACNKLIYNALGAQVDVVGAGTMLAEDYRPPAAKPDRPVAASPDEPMTGNVESPSQTAFKWSKSMIYLQEQRSVSLEGQVLMVHRSGDKVVLADQIRRPVWPDVLPGGRRSEITCEKMLARFDAPPKAATRPATAPAGDDLDLGPRLGPLRLFNATGDVNMRDGNRQILAQRLVYDRSEGLDLAVIWGYLTGQPEADAQVYEEDPEKGTSRSWSSPQIIWDRKSNAITVQKASGSGGR